MSEIVSDPRVDLQLKIVILDGKLAETDVINE